MVCTTPLVVTLDESGSLYETASCTSSTGLDFYFEFDLFVTFDCEYGTPEAACLAGSASLTLPSGDVYTASFAERGFLAGYVTTATGPLSFFSLTFAWRPTIETPSGPVGYYVGFTAYPEG